MGSAEGVRAILCPRVKSSQVSEATHSHSELFDPNVSSPGSWEEELVGQVKSSQVKSWGYALAQRAYRPKCFPPPVSRAMTVILGVRPWEELVEVKSSQVSGLHTRTASVPTQMLSPPVSWAMTVILGLGRGRNYSKWP